MIVRIKKKKRQATLRRSSCECHHQKSLKCVRRQWTKYKSRMQFCVWFFPYRPHVLLLLFSHPGMSNSLRPHRLQHTRPLCPSPSPEVCQVHIHCIGDAIQPSHPLTSSSPYALNLSQHQRLFQRFSCLHQMTKILEFQSSFKIDCFDLAIQGTLRSLLQHHSSKAINSLALCLLHSPALTTICESGKTIILTMTQTLT